MGGPTGGSSAGAQRMRLSPEASGGMDWACTAPLMIQHLPLPIKATGPTVKDVCDSVRRLSDCETGEFVWLCAGAHQVLAGAELPGAVPRQAAAPGHGTGGHFRAVWTPHLPSAAPIACHQITKGSSRRALQT